MTYIEPSETDIDMATELLRMLDEYEGMTPFGLASIIVHVREQERERCAMVCNSVASVDLPSCDIQCSVKFSNYN